MASATPHATVGWVRCFEVVTVFYKVLSRGFRGGPSVSASALRQLKRPSNRSPIRLSVGDMCNMCTYICASQTSKTNGGWSDNLDGCPIAAKVIAG